VISRGANQHDYNTLDDIYGSSPSDDDGGGKSKPCNWPAPRRRPRQIECVSRRDADAGRRGPSGPRCNTEDSHRTTAVATNSAGSIALWNLHSVRVSPGEPPYWVAHIRQYGRPLDPGQAPRNDPVTTDLGIWPRGCRGRTTATNPGETSTCHPPSPVPPTSRPGATRLPVP